MVFALSLRPAPTLLQNNNRATSALAPDGPKIWPRRRPRKTPCYGVAKVHLDADAEALVWLRRSLDANRNYSFAHFNLAAALARLGELDEARAAVRAGLALNPSFSIRRFRDATSAWHDNPTSLAGRDRTIEGMRLAGVPEG